LDHLQGASRVAYFTSSALGATPKMIQKTSKMVYLFYAEAPRDRATSLTVTEKIRESAAHHLSKKKPA